MRYETFIRRHMAIMHLSHKTFSKHPKMSDKFAFTVPLWVMLWYNSELGKKTSLKEYFSYNMTTVVLDRLLYWCITDFHFTKRFILCSCRHMILHLFWVNIFSWHTSIALLGCGIVHLWTLRGCTSITLQKNGDYVNSHSGGRLSPS